MRIAYIILFMAGFVGAVAQTTGPAKSAGQCSVANTGKVGKVVIDCGIGRAQAQQMTEILNVILTNQQKLPADLVLMKLDEILKNVNPNAAVRSYLCNGMWRSAGPGANTGFEVIVGGDTKEADALFSLLNSRKYLLALDQCQADMKANPTWLTPELVCGIAYLSLGDTVHAKKMIDDFDSRTGPAYSDGACKQMSDILHRSPLR